MNLFLKNLSNTDNQLLVRRAESINVRAKMTFETLINQIRLEIENKKLKLQDLTVMGPESTTSLNPVSADWNPNTWCNEVQSISMEIKDLTEQLAVAMENYETYFIDKEKLGVDKTVSE